MCVIKNWTGKNFIKVEHFLIRSGKCLDNVYGFIAFVCFIIYMVIKVKSLKTSITCFIGSVLNKSHFPLKSSFINSFQVFVKLKVTASFCIDF